MNLTATWRHAMTVSKPILALLLLFKHSDPWSMYPFLLSTLLGGELGIVAAEIQEAADRTVRTARLDYESLEISCLPRNIYVRIIWSREGFVLGFIEARHVDVRRRWFTHMLYSSAILNGWLTTFGCWWSWCILRQIPDFSFVRKADRNRRTVS